MTRAERLVEAARRQRRRIAVAESCTGGLLAAAITNVPGASDVFDCGFVTYSNEAKQEMLGVSALLIAEHGAVSEEVARQMAEGAIDRSAAGLAVALTGIAGPGGSEHKPEGRVCFAVAGPFETWSETVEFGALGRSEVRARSVDHALDMLLAAPPLAP